MDSPIIFPAPKIKEEDDLSDIIDLDEDKTPEDLVYEWDSKVRLKIKNYFIVDSEQSLDTLMKWYIQSVKDEVVDFDDFPVVKVLIAKHIQFFKLYFVELSSCFVDNYLDNMEEILTFYSNLEVKSLPAKRKDGNKHAFKKLLLSMCQKIVSMLSLYLLNREDRVYHVVMKIKLNSLPEDSKELLNLIYRKLLTQDPSDKSDLGFCRAYILYQKWKTVRKPDDWEKMDAIMYKLYQRTAESVKTNEILTQILLPQNNSVLDVLIHFSEKHVIITEEYFKFLKSKKTQEESLILPELSNIEISDEILPDLTDNSEDGDFDRAYQNFVKTMSTLAQGNSNPQLDDCVTVKIEDEDDDDCQIVAVSSLGYESESTELVHEILEDDDDIEIIYFKKKEQQNMAQKDKEKSGLSFLDSIEIPDPSEDVPSEKVSSSSCTTVLPSKPSRNMVTTSTNTSPDSSKRNLSAQESVVQIVNSSISTSSAQERTKPDTDYQRSSVTTSVTNLEIETECISSASKNSIDMETSAKALTISHSVQIKNVTNMQTQTDDIDGNITDGNSCPYNDEEITKSHTLEKSAEEGNCYNYGIVTPPSDQPLDEHVSPNESDMYPNVYAKIARTHNAPDETDHIAKVLDYLPSSVEEANLEKHSESLPNSCEMDAANDLISPLNEQSCNNVEDQSTLCQADFNVGSDMEFEPSIEPNAKKKHDIIGKDVDSTDVCLNQCESDSESLVVAEEKIVDNADLNQGTSENLDKNNATEEHELNFNSENCSIQEVAAENLTNALLASTDSKTSYGSPDTHTCSSNPSILSDISLKYSVPSNSDMFKTPVASGNSPCTSTDIDTSQDYSKSASIPLSNGQREIRSVSCPSPDITSTSTDIQDLHENFSAQEGDSGEGHLIYDNYCCDVSETEEYLINENQCSEEYIEYSECNVENGDFKNNENVSQSNLDDGEGSEEIFIEDTVVMNNEEELSYIIEDALPIGANVNICLENHSNDSSIHSDLCNGDNNRESNEIVQSEVINQVEKVNEESIPVTPFKELKVAVEKLYVPDDAGTENNKLNSPKKIMFTSPEKLSVDEFTKFQDSFHLRWKALKETHDLDEIFSGPVSKVNGISSSVNPDTNFDLFNSKASSISGANSPQTPLNSSANNSGEVTSPAYEEIDDFRSYYEENKNSNMLDLSPVQNLTPVGDKSTSLPPHHHKDKVKVSLKIFPKNLKTLQNREVSINNSASVDVNRKDRTLKTKAPTNGKRMRIAFAEHVIDTSNTVSHSPTENTNDVLQGILKKTSSDAENYRLNGKRTRPRIPRRMMNLKSLAQFNVKPNDPCIQGVPCVVIERLSDSEISQWLHVSEISRTVRLEKQRAQFASQQLTCRVDYDKQTTHINENDVLRFSTPEGITTIPVHHTLGLRHWRSNATLQSNTSSLDEGMLAITPTSTISDNDYLSIPVPCKNSCCNSLTDDLTNLNVSRIQHELILNCGHSKSDPNLKCFCPSCHLPKPNPFLLESNTPKKNCESQGLIFSRKTRHNYGDIANLIQSDTAYNKVIDSTENFKFKCKDAPNANVNLNTSNFENDINLNLNQQQPAIVPQVAEFENTIRSEEMEETDLYILNLKKFSSSPIINSFGPPSISPSHTFPRDTCRIENVPILPVTEEFDSKSRLYDDVATCVDPSKNPCNDVDVSVPNYSIPSEISSYNSAELNSYNFENETNKNRVVTEESDIIPKDQQSELSNTNKECVKSETLTKLETEAETRLPLKKRKLPVTNTKEEIINDIDPDRVEKIIKRARAAEVKKEVISYPAKPMISIAEIQEKLTEPHPRVFKTPAERKEMPPPASTYANPSESPRIVTEQYNNHTYNNPTINYHMNNVPYPFFPCGSLPYFPPIILPINSTTTFDLVTAQQQSAQQSTTGQAPVGRPRRERRTRRQKNT